MDEVSTRLTVDSQKLTEDSSLISNIGSRVNGNVWQVKKSPLWKDRREVQKGMYFVNRALRGSTSQGTLSINYIIIIGQYSDHFSQ